MMRFFWAEHGFGEVPNSRCTLSPPRPRPENENGLLMKGLNMGAGEGTRCQSRLAARGVRGVVHTGSPAVRQGGRTGGGGPGLIGRAGSAGSSRLTSDLFKRASFGPPPHPPHPRPSNPPTSSLSLLTSLSAFFLVAFCGQAKSGQCTSSQFSLPCPYVWVASGSPKQQMSVTWPSSPRKPLRRGSQPPPCSWRARERGHRLCGGGEANGGADPSAADCSERLRMNIGFPLGRDGFPVHLVG